MIIQSPGEIAFSILNFPIYYYGIVLAFAIFVGIYTAYKLYQHFYDKDSAEKIMEMAPYIVILGIVSARLYYCLMNLTYYTSNLLDVFNIRQGGLSIHGMIFFGSFFLWYFAKHYKLSTPKVFDVFLCGTALAQSIGRWGNFFNSEAFGMPFDGFIKLYIPITQRPLQYIDVQYFHPAFLYESCLDLILFATLFILFRRFSEKPGLISSFYLIFYGMIRIFTEQIRLDSALNIHGIPIAQWASVAIIFIGILLIPVVLKKKI